MGVESELTDDELKEFANFGVDLSTPTEPAAEPVVEPTAPVEPAEPAAPAAEGPLRDPATGQFLPKEQQPAAAPAADPAAPADPNAPPVAPVDPNAPPPTGFVPHQALHQERLARQQAQQQFAQLQARTNAILAAQRPEPAALPSLETDPVGYVRGLEERLRTFEATQAETQQQQQIEAAMRQEESIYQSYTPDYPQASEHYVQSRAQELLAFHPPQQVMQIMMTEARQIAQEAWTRGIPAPQLFYQLAQARGYQPGAAPAAPAPQPAAQAPQPVLTSPAAIPAQPVGAPTAAAVVAAVQTGQNAVRTLSGGGAASAADMNAEALLSMSDEDFEAYLKLGQKGANQRFAAIG